MRTSGILMFIQPMIFTKDVFHNFFHDFLGRTRKQPQNCSGSLMLPRWMTFISFTRKTLIFTVMIDTNIIRYNVLYTPEREPNAWDKESKRASICQLCQYCSELQNLVQSSFSIFLQKPLQEVPPNLAGLQL